VFAGRCDCSGGRDNAAGDEALPALVPARERRVAFGDVLTATHCLLRRQGERLTPLRSLSSALIANALSVLDAPVPGSDLALQLSFCFEVRTLSDRLVSSAPE
jgi:hypothetical protein